MRTLARCKVVETSFGWVSGILVDIVEVGDSKGGYRTDCYQARPVR